MSFEADKARLVKELDDAQTEIRAQYGMKPRKDPLSDDSAKAKQSPKKPGTAATA